MIRLRRSSVQIMLLVCTFFVFAASIYFQYVAGLTPCPLCLMQRICVVALILIIFTGLGTKNAKYRPRILTVQIVVALAGVYFASRQIWLQNLPDGQLMSCVPGLDIMIQYFPWQSIAKALFWGSGDCGEVVWQWLGISMAGWSLLYFIVMTVVSIFMRIKYRHDSF